MPWPMIEIPVVMIAFLLLLGLGELMMRADNRKRRRQWSEQELAEVEHRALEAVQRIHRQAAAARQELHHLRQQRSGRL